MKSKVLFVVEGKVEEVKILANKKHGLLKFIDFDYEIVSFCNPIYELYEAYKNGDYDDLVTYLRVEKGLKIDKNILSKNAFAAIYLIFDYEPHYQKYSDEYIKDLLNIFNNETELGKLYINYPTVEAFYHLKDSQDKEFLTRCISLINFSGKEYKKIVNKESYIVKNKITNNDLISIIKHNFEKIKYLGFIKQDIIEYNKILNEQIKLKNNKGNIYVLSTMPLLLYDYNPESVLNLFNEVIEN